MMDTVWTCADGRKVLVSKMEYSHLLNCIAKIRRSRKGWRREYLPRLELELTIRSIKGTEQ